MPETSWYQTNFIKIYYIWSDKDTDNCHINDCSFHIFIIILFVLKSFNVCSLKVPVIIWLIWERSSNDTVYTIVFILYVIMTLSIYRALKFDIRLVQIRLPVWQDRFFFRNFAQWRFQKSLMRVKMRKSQRLVRPWIHHGHCPIQFQTWDFLSPSWKAKS